MNINVEQLGLDPEIVGLVVSTFLHWLIYSFLLWIMIKIQKLQYSGLGLLASAAVAEAVSFIPVVGPYAAYVVLVIGLWKVTRAPIAPDVIFTISVAGALMFCVNLYGLSTLMGHLGLDGEDAEVTVEASEEEHESVVLEEDPAPSPAPNVPTRVRARAHPTGILLKGIGYNTAKPIAIIEYGRQVYSIEQGEGLILRNKNSPLHVLCDRITRSSVVLKIDNQEEVELLLE